MKSIPKTMKAAMVVKHGKPLEIKEVPVPEPGPLEVLIEMEVTGVCHTDLHVRDGDWVAKCPLPMTPGHEGVGVVVKCGSDVSNVKVGDRVCTPWLHSSCSHCEHCITGWETTCETQLNSGFTAQGSFAQYMKAPAKFVGKVPDKLSSDQAAPITCAGVTVLKGLKVSEVKPGQYMVIVGACGGLGHLAIQYAKVMGMKVIGIDASDGCEDFMKKIGCDHAINGKKGDVVAEVKKITTDGAHGALILVPSHACTKQAVTYVRRRGTVVLIALPDGHFEGNTFDIVLRAIRIQGSIVGTRQDLAEALQFGAEGKVKCEVQKRPFSEVNKVMDELQGGKIKGRVVLDMKKL